MKSYYESEEYLEHIKSIKKNREFVIERFLNQYNKVINDSYFYLKMRYIEGDKAMFINNSTARRHLIEEEIMIIDMIFKERGERYND